MEVVGNVFELSRYILFIPQRQELNPAMDPDDSPWQDNTESLRDTEWSKYPLIFRT